MARILVTDDAAFMRMMLKNIITKMGHECIEACNGAEMLAKADSHRPDLITLDITMPEMSGIEALRVLRSTPFGYKVPVIMCSAMGQKAMVMDAIQAGAKDFLVKPFQEEKVKETINRYIN